MKLLSALSKSEAPHLFLVSVPVPLSCCDPNSGWECACGQIPELQGLSWGVKGLVPLSFVCQVRVTQRGVWSVQQF